MNKYTPGGLRPYILFLALVSIFSVIAWAAEMLWKLYWLSWGRLKIKSYE